MPAIRFVNLWVLRNTCPEQGVVLAADCCSEFGILGATCVLDFVWDCPSTGWESFQRGRAKKLHACGATMINPIRFVFEDSVHFYSTGLISECGLMFGQRTMVLYGVGHSMAVRALLRVRDWELLQGSVHHMKTRKYPEILKASLRTLKCLCFSWKNQENSRNLGFRVICHVLWVHTMFGLGTQSNIDG